MEKLSNEALNELIELFDRLRIDDTNRIDDSVLVCLLELKQRRAETKLYKDNMKRILEIYLGYLEEQIYDSTLSRKIDCIHFLIDNE